jgi:hypothetical protein
MEKTGRTATTRPVEHYDDLAERPAEAPNFLQDSRYEEKPVEPVVKNSADLAMFARTPIDERMRAIGNLKSAALSNSKTNYNTVEFGLASLGRIARQAERRGIRKEAVHALSEVVTHPVEVH